MEEYVAPELEMIDIGEENAILTSGGGTCASVYACSNAYNPA